MEVPKFLFPRRAGEEDLGGSHEVEFVKLAIRFVVATQTRLGLVAGGGGF